MTDVVERVLLDAVISALTGTLPVLEGAVTVIAGVVTDGLMESRTDLISGRRNILGAACKNIISMCLNL